MNKIFGIFMIVASMVACGKTTAPVEVSDVGSSQDVVTVPDDVTAVVPTDDVTVTVSDDATQSAP